LNGELKIFFMHEKSRFQKTGEPLKKRSDMFNLNQNVMKTLRLFLGVFAFVFAIGGAFASKHSLSTMGYERIPATGTAVQCLSHVQCDQSGDPDCKFRKVDNSLVPLWDASNPTINCGAILKHSQNSGIVNP
jgi:hypothetical protein